MSNSSKTVSEEKCNLLLRGYVDIQNAKVKLVAILVWAEKADLRKNGRSFKFDATVMQGIMEYYKKNHHFTIKQAQAIWKIHREFKLDEWFQKNMYNCDNRRKWDDLMAICNIH
jgi:hypothetical protein